MIRTACGLAPLAPLTWACAADLTWAGRPKSSVALVRSLLPDAVHGAEGGRGQGGERAGVVGHRRWDALPAGQPGGDQSPGVPLVGGAARFTGGGAAVATRDPVVPSSSWSEEYSVRTSPVLVLTSRLAPRSRTGRAQSWVRCCAEETPASPSRRRSGTGAGAEPCTASGSIRALPASMSVSRDTEHAGGKPWSISHRRAVRVTLAVAGGPGTATTAHNKSVPPLLGSDAAAVGSVG